MGRVFPDVAFGADIEGVGWVDHAWMEAGLSMCHWNGAPGGLATRRQLRELGLCPGGHPPVAALRRRPGGYLHAWLYRMDRAREKRNAIPAVLRALGAAMWCPAHLLVMWDRHRSVFAAVVGVVLAVLGGPGRHRPELRDERRTHRRRTQHPDREGSSGMSFDQDQQRDHLIRLGSFSAGSGLRLALAGVDVDVVAGAADGRCWGRTARRS